MIMFDSYPWFSSDYANSIMHPLDKLVRHHVLKAYANYALSQMQRLGIYGNHSPTQRDEYRRKKVVVQFRYALEQLLENRVITNKRSHLEMDIGYAVVDRKRINRNI